MTINCNSWHYRWVMAWRRGCSLNSVPTNLCEYFRWMVLVPSFALLMGSSAALCLGVVVYMLGWWLIDVTNVPHVREGILVGILSLVAGQIMSRKFHPTRPHLPEPIVAYIKAKKAHICPLLTYK